MLHKPASLALASILTITLASCDQLSSQIGNAPASVFETGLSDSANTVKFGAQLPASSVIPSQLALISTGRDQGLLLSSLSGHILEPSSRGKTGGLSIALSPEFEAMASGNQIKITIVAKSQTAGNKVKVAYSTNDVGNSGWKEFELSPELSAFSFTYDVNTMRNGKNDYFGIVPGEGNSGSIELALISAEVIPASEG